MDVDWKVGFCEGHARVLENPLHYTYFYIESTPYNVGGARGLGARARARTRHGLEGRRGTSLGRSKTWFKCSTWQDLLGVESIDVTSRARTRLREPCF